MSDYLIKINEVSLQDILFNLELAEIKKPQLLGAENDVNKITREESSYLQF
jgi:hypothetical protein